mgnify:CR=1 FL=1
MFDTETEPAFKVNFIASLFEEQVIGRAINVRLDGELHYFNVAA